jgi:hypothetical protein
MAFIEQLLRRLPLFDHGGPNEGCVYILRVYSANYTLPTPRRECYPSGGYDIQYSFNLRGGVACLPGVINTSNSTLYITLPLAADSAQGTKDERYSVALPPALLLSP